MKRIALAIALAFFPAISGFSQAKDDEGHTLINLWKTFYKAEQNDLPQDKVKALEAIKKEAKAKNLAWDWYDAASRYVYARSSINWKDHDKCNKAFQEEITALDEPVIVFYHNSNSEQEEYVEKNKARLQRSYNPEFHKRDNRINSAIYAPALLKLIKNDYEYALWSMWLGRKNGDLKDYCKGRYPEEALIEYSEITRYMDKSADDKLSVYENKYSGKAVSLLARQRRLQWQFRELNNSGTAKPEDYKKLREACEKLERDRKQYSGTEKLIADCCKDTGNIIKTLDSKEINITAKDNELTLTLRNVSSLNLQVKKDEKTVWETSLGNKAASYYVPDTLKTTLPDLDDDDYVIFCKSGTCESSSSWNKHTLSIAVRPDSRGLCAFVADYISGKPLDSCILLLHNADGLVIAASDDFRPNGFTLLPSTISSTLNSNKSRCRLSAQFRDKNGRLRNSRTVSVSKNSQGTVSEGADVEHAMLITDRRAFNPGETVQFKGICYTGTYEYRLAPAGYGCVVTLSDPEGKEIGRKLLTTNEFGSVEGSFPLSTKGSRGGMYAIDLQTRDGKRLSHNTIRVDEFVLPTFELTWDADNHLYLPGDRIVVSGKVKAYSGHSLGNVRVRYTVSNSLEKDASGELMLDSDGSFSFAFEASGKRYHWSYPITVTVTDGTGETLSFSTIRVVRSEIGISLRMQNNVKGTYHLIGGGGSGSGIIREDTAEVLFDLGGLDRKDLKISYKVTADAGGKQVAAGTARAGETVSVPIAQLPSGLYRIQAVATAIMADGSTTEDKVSTTFVKASDSDTSLDMDVAAFFKELDSDDIALQIGSTDGPVWAVVELFGSGNVLLDSQIIQLEGARGRAGSLKTISYTRRSGWPESLKLCAFFFHKGTFYRYSRSIQLPTPSIELPLAFTRFVDRVRPGEECSLIIKTDPGVECAATVFDKATETIASNKWAAVTLTRRPEPSVYYSEACGINESGYIRPFYSYRTAAMAKSSGVMMEEAMAPNSVMESMEADAIPFQLRDTADDAVQPAVRENFAATMAWEPCLRSDARGNIELKFKGADRLSTYYLQLFAHAKGMHNAVLRREMQVTIPVKLSMVEPKFLYEGDIYVARATVASTLETPLSGRVAIRFYDGKDWRNSRVLATKLEKVTLPAGETRAFSAPFTVPEGLQELGVLLNFIPDDETVGSDAMFVTIPVYKPFQTLTEAHSALLRNPGERENVIAELRSLFVNMDASQLEPQERSILDMVREAIPDKVEPRNDDVLSLTEAWYSNVLARRLGAPGLDEAALKEIAGKIAACQNAGGGIAWFEGMQSSPIITAVVLERIAAMSEETCSIDISAAVKYLDASYFEKNGLPSWCGGLSLEQYLHTRALYPYVPFESPGGKAFRQFKKDVKAYLVPTGKRGMNGQILSKARRLRTLQLLAVTPEGQQLAKAWGISFKKCILKSMESDIKSLLQYAVEHVSGGYYYPNAVMPWRGLLESELYAHTLLCNLLTDSSSSLRSCQNDSTLPVILSASEGSTVAEGIRLWLMIQKETQQWGTDPAYLEALACVLDGKPETLNTKVIVLSGSYTKPFEAVKETGNGMIISCKWYLKGKELADGDKLALGDRITARYQIWNEENRSFVRISAPRPASLRPVAQLSGHYGWWLSPLRFGSWSISPQGYRNVLADKTEYWFDSYPEENTTVSEDFFVTQEGAFQTPAIEIESLYAPHYRANGSGLPVILSEAKNLK